MVSYSVRPEKQRELEAMMQKMGVVEEDLEERFIRGAGGGGQKLNKTSSSVTLLHKPSGIRVRCQESRSQSLNRYLARRRLLDKLAELRGEGRSKKELERGKIRRQKERRKRRARRKEDNNGGSSPNGSSL